MTITEQLAKHLDEVHSGGNWTWVNLRDTLADVSWQQAITKPESCNSIAALTFHINYFINVVNNALTTNVLDGNDKLSFDHPPVNSAKDWDEMRNKLFSDAKLFTQLIAALPQEKLTETFFNEKYGNYLRNILGIIEHTHYHLGQITIIKKMLPKAT